jgi:hypothetical protein
VIARCSERRNLASTIELWSRAKLGSTRSERTLPESQAVYVTDAGAGRDADRRPLARILTGQRGQPTSGARRRGVLVAWTARIATFALTPGG